MRKYLLLPVSILLLITVTNKITAQSTHITGPAGSGQFGGNVTVLTNGNYVVSDQFYDDGAIADVGAAYLYNGSTHALISMLKGSTANDRVGNSGVVALTNGNFVVLSNIWDNGALVNVGAVTWGNGNTGVSGIVSSSNSLVGSTANDNVGGAISVLPNGNYVVTSTGWDNGAVVNAGAVTWGNGLTGIIGAVSSSNSIVGGTANDYVGNGGITVLPNSNYIIKSGNWTNGTFAFAGAMTWCNGTTGKIGVVSSSNSLVGGKDSDQVGIGGVTVLSNGNYVVNSYNWKNVLVFNAGAVTWGDGTTGISGVVNSSNSLVGSTAFDNVGLSGVAILPNGNYLVISPNWDNGAATNAGAVTWGNGNTGIFGIISNSNSLVGSTTNNQVGLSGVTVLTNGNYLVVSPYWDNGVATDAGAVTWGNGSTGVSGIVSSSNSLVGNTINNSVGINGVVALSNGNYVVKSPYWDNGAVMDVGAATWGNGNTGLTGVVSNSNSLVGSTAVDQVGVGVYALSNGNYVVYSGNWDNGTATNAGAVTWGNGSTGISGIVSTSNSLVGSTTSDVVGIGGITALSNGNYVVKSDLWDNGATSDVGAVTWGNGSTGITGVVSSSNSLVGSIANDNAGNNGVTALANGNYIVGSGLWDNGAIANAGAVTWGNGSTGISGIVSSSNSMVGSIANDNVGSNGVTSLSNGNYVVRSLSWDNGAVVNAGAVTWGNGSTGTSGIVNSSNSLVGSSINDNVGFVIPLTNGNYLVSSQSWDNGAVINVGAVSWGNGSIGTSGIISNSNSLIGSTTNDQVGGNGITVLSNGNYLVRSNDWDNGAVVNTGAVTWGNGSSNGVSGVITACNSVRGTATLVGSGFASVYNSVYDYLVVGRPSDNIVTIFNASAMSLANTLDAIAVGINGTTPVPLIASSDCRIIATLTSNGASPVSGMLNAKAWIEPSVPTYGGKPFVARHYEITPVTNPSTSTGRVTLYFTQQEFADFNAHPGSIDDLPANPGDAIGKSNLKIAKYSGGTNNGTGLPGSYSGGTTIIDPVDADIIWNSSLNRWEVSFNVTGFSGFIVQTNATVLPLTLLDFNGRLVNSNAVLNWKTENEQNTSHFEIERSVDGNNYTTAGTVTAANQSGVHQYNFVDDNVSTLGTSVLYYRLKQIDIDGRFTYSRIVVLTLDHNKNIVLFYPNPVINEANVTISTAKSGLVQARIIDNIGRVVQQLQWNVTAGSNAYSINVSGLTKGMYYLELKGESINERKQFVKQ